MDQINSENILSLIKEVKSELLPIVNFQIVENGSAESIITHIAPPETCNNKSLVFASTPMQIDEVFKKQAPFLIVMNSIENLDWMRSKSDLNSYYPHLKLPTIVSTKSIPHAMAMILPKFDNKKSRFSPLGTIHPSASIHPHAKIGKNVTIGAFTTIGFEVCIGDDSIIGPHCILESHSKVGENSTLHGFVFLGANCTVGHDCEIHSHSTIGADGFGFAPTAQAPIKIPQLGNVEIGDYVEIGAGCCIDRATLTTTKIGNGTKLDNLIHIGHNCEIGENGLIAAGFMIAGSSKIGRKFMSGGNSVVTNHVNIADNVVLAGRSTVTKDISESGQYGGYPLQPIKEALKTIALLPHLFEMKKQISQIVKHLKLSNNEDQNKNSKEKLNL